MSGLPVVLLDRLRENPANPRGDLGDLSELTASILTVGLLQPLVVQQHHGGTWLVLDGHRRLAAARAAGVKALPCLAVRPGAEDQQVATMLAAAMHKRLEPMEQAVAFRKLRDRGLDVKSIAARTGYSAGTVTDRLRLLRLPAEAQQMVTEKTITVREATDLARQVQKAGRGEATVITPRTAWLTASHSLAPAVASACTHRETRRMIGGSGCGQCWEDTIRADERAHPRDAA